MIFLCSLAWSAWICVHASSPKLFNNFCSHFVEFCIPFTNTCVWAATGYWILELSVWSPYLFIIKDPGIIYIYIYIYTGCPGGNVPDLGRMFLTLKNTDITKNTYVWSWMVTEIMAREKCGLLVVPHTVPGSCDVLPVHCACPSFSLQPGQAHSRCDFVINSCHCYS